MRLRELRDGRDDLPQFSTFFSASGGEFLVASGGACGEPPPSSQLQLQLKNVHAVHIMLKLMVIWIMVLDAPTDCALALQVG